MEQSSNPISWKHDLRALPFIAPFMLLFGVFIAWPLIYSLWISVHEVTIYSDFYDIFGTMKFVGFGNYSRILQDPIFWWSVLLTFAYAALTIVPGIALSLSLALAVNRPIKGYGILRSGFFLPNVFDVYVVGVIWLLIYNPNGGLFSQVVSLFGLQGLAAKGMLNDPWLTLPGIALVMILKNAGFGMILFLTSLSNMNESIFEAADVDGASSWQKLLYITIPMLRPIILFLSVTGLVGTLNAFAEIYALTDDTGGTSVSLGSQTLQSARISGYHLFKAFNESMYGDAAAISFLLLIIALVISYFNCRLLTDSD